MRGPVSVGRAAVAAAAIAVTGVAAAAQVNPGDLRREAEALLGSALETVTGRESVDAPAWLPPEIGGALSSAVFSVPVGGGAVSRPVYAEVRNDLVIVLAPQWRIVQALVGDASRWQVTNNEFVLVVKPLERGAQTNLSLVLASGEVLQLDLVEVTPYGDLERVGRVYLGPEPWLLDRVFALLPPGLGPAVLDADVSVPDLLADPARVVYSFLYGRPGGLSGSASRAPARAAPRPAPPLAAAPRPAPFAPPVAEPTEALDAGPPLPPGFSPGVGTGPPSGGGPLPPVPGLPGLPVPVPPVEPVRPVEDVDPVVSSTADAPGTVNAAPVIEPALGVFSGAPLSNPRGGASARGLDPFLWSGAEGGGIESAPVPRSAGTFVAARPARQPGAGPVPERRPFFVTSADLVVLRARRDALRRQIDAARSSTGDQVANASLGIDRELEELRVEYPGRVQLSLHWDPDLPPLAPPFWQYGLWHDSTNTFVRILAPSPLFRDESLDVEIAPARIDRFLYRLPGVVEEGSVTVSAGGGFTRAYWSRRPEVEAPAAYRLGSATP